MVRSVSVLVAILSCAATATAVACTLGPEAMFAPPRDERSELQLPDRAPEPALVYPTGKYEIRVRPADLLEVIKSGTIRPLPLDSFGGRLESLLPLQADIAVREILTPLAPEAPAAGEKTQRALKYRRFWRQSDERLRYDLAVLLQSGRATVVEKSSGAALPMVIRHNYGEGCYGSRKFLTPDGALIMQTYE